jgi:cytochrome c oxidase cbb3-type subunit 3
MMQGRIGVAAALAAFALVFAHASAQGPQQQAPAGVQPAAQPPAPAQPPPAQPPAPAQPQPAPPAAPEGQPAGGRGQGRGQGRGRGPGTFPAQQRQLADPAVIERGRSIYSVTCTACHGADLRGGQLGGPNLLRSQLVLNDQHGELIMPIVRGARAERGMPPIPLPDDDIVAVAEYIHSVAAAGAGQGAPPPTALPPPDIVVGDAQAGRAYFAATCSKCHSVTGDLQGLAARIPDPKTLQNTWVSGGAAGGRGRGGGSGAARRPVTVSVALPSGETLQGRLLRIDHFLVTLEQEDGTIRSVRRNGDTPRIAIEDPAEAHRALLQLYTEKDMHDLTAYLVTLK